MNTRTIKTQLLVILACFVSNLNFAQDEIELKNSNLEGVDKNGNFFWWKHQAKDSGKGVFSVENSDLINGSKKALKAEIKSLASKGRLVNFGLPMRLIKMVNTIYIFHLKTRKISSELGLLFLTNRKARLKQKRISLKVAIVLTLLFSMMMLVSLTCALEVFGGSTTKVGK